MATEQELINMPTALLAPDALLRKALTTHDTTVKKVALLGTLLTLSELFILSSLWLGGLKVLRPYVSSFPGLMLGVFH